MTRAQQRELKRLGRAHERLLVVHDGYACCRCKIADRLSELQALRCREAATRVTTQLCKA